MTSLELWDEIQTGLERSMAKASVILTCLIIKTNEKLATEELPEELARLYTKFKEQLQDMIDSFDGYREIFQEIRNRLAIKEADQSNVLLADSVK